MKWGPISTGTASACAVIIAAVMTTVVAAALLVPGEGTGAPVLSPASPVETVAGYAGVPAIRISGTGNPVNLTECRVYLIDPGGTLLDVETAILQNTTLAEGQATYIFHFPVNDSLASGYWITDEPGMVFSTAYHPGIQPFSPGGQWRVVVYDPQSMKNRIDRAFRISGPSSPD